MNEGPDRRARARSTALGVLSLNNLEQVRLLLRGGSVIDWFRLNLKNEADALEMLAVQSFEMENPKDLLRLTSLIAQAADYLENELGTHVTAELRESDIVDLLLRASRVRGSKEESAVACQLLKTIHIIHHVEARELRYRLPTSPSELAQLLKNRVEAFASELRREGFPLVSFSGGEKAFESVVTKLLVKRENHSAAVRDRVRFRFVTETPSDIIPLLHRMTSRLLPFNYIVPEQSTNHLVNFTALVESHRAYREVAESFQVKLGEEQKLRAPLNEFSGATFQVINFVADIPLRVPDDIITSTEWFDGLGSIIFTLAEFQVVDKETNVLNESGDNRHEAYRDRQLDRVRQRLLGKNPT